MNQNSRTDNPRPSQNSESSEFTNESGGGDDEKLLVELTWLNQWSWGITIGTCVFVAMAILFRGLSDISGRQVLAIIALIAFMWRYLLLSDPSKLRIRPMLWMNNFVMLTLITMILLTTGAALSPFFWMYVVVIALETWQHRDRGVVIAWASLAFYCALILLQWSHHLPTGFSDLEAELYPLPIMALWQALGVAVWYLTLAVIVTVFTRWVNGHEAEIHRKKERLAQAERLLEEKQTEHQTQNQEMIQQRSAIEKTQRQLDVDLDQWNKLKNQWDLESAKRALQLANQETAARMRIHELDVRQANHQAIQQQQEDAQKNWEQERAKAVQSLKDREKAQVARAAELDESYRGVEAQRAHTTQTLMELEGTLLARLKRIGEEMAHVEQARRELGAKEQALSAKEDQWVREEARARQSIESKTKELADLEQRAETAQKSFDSEYGRKLNELKQEHLEIEKERQRAEESLQQRESELETQEQRISAAALQLETRRSELEQNRQRMEAQAIAHEATDKQDGAKADALQKARKKLETDRQAFAEDQQAHAAEIRELQATKKTAEEALQTREKELAGRHRQMDQKQRDLEAQREEWEQKQKNLLEHLDKNSKNLSAERQAHDESKQQLALLKRQLEDKRKELEIREQKIAQTSVHTGEEFSLRLKELKSLQQQLEEERLGLDRQRAQIQSQQQAMQELESISKTEDNRLEMTGPNKISLDTFASLANELNAPLTSLEALLAALVDGDHGSMPSEALQEAIRTAHHLHEIHLNILDLVWIEQGKLTVSLKPTKLHELLARATEKVKNDAGRKGIALSREGEDSTVVMVDPEHACRILTAVLQNAVDYTEHGQIKVSCSTQNDGAVITVTDSGVGIQPGSLGQLFTKPKVGDLLRGKGIGLYLSQGLASLMAAKVRLVSSELGSGSKFEVTFSTTPKSAHAAQNGGKVAVSKQGVSNDKTIANHA